MRRLAVAFLWVSISIPAMAFERSDVTWEFFPLNGQVRFEMGQEQDLAPRQALNFAFGAQRMGYGFVLEVSDFTVQTGGGFSSIGRDHKELVAWFRKDFAGFSKLRWLIGGGVGLSQDEVTTQIDGLRVTDQSKAEPLAAFSLGPQFTFWSVMRVSLEGRLFFGSGFDPDPQPDIVLRTGVAF